MEDAEIKKMVREVLSNQAYPQSEAETRLAVLESYECWDAFFLLLEEVIQTSSQPKEYLIRKAVVQGVSLENINEAAQTCQTIISRFGLTFHEFSEQIGRLVVAPEAWENEAALLREVVHRLPDNQSKVACLERLCFIYERKTSEERELTRSFSEIRELDPDNIKALRFFKLIQMRNREWEDVAHSLKKLIDVSPRKHEVYRYAQELATVYLYHLNEPESSIDCLDRYCSGSPLDDSAIRLEAYYNLNRWLDCLTIIENEIPRIDNPSGLAVAHYRKGTLHEKLGDLELADRSYLQALENQPAYLEAIERRIGIATSRLDWTKVCGLLGILLELTRDSELRDLLEEARDRILSLISGAVSNDMETKRR